MSSNRSASLNKFKVVLGYILLFISIILFRSFVSYMFNWKVDQSNVNSLFDRDVQVENILGKVGASISHFFIFKLFGIGSFVIPIILFISSYFILFNKKISLEKIVEKMCHNPAILFQIKKRGFVREGYFADLVLIDLNKSWTVNKGNLLYKCKWSPFENVTFNSKVTHTIINGNLAFSHGKVSLKKFGVKLEFER